MRPSDLSLRVSLRKQPCVLDPVLILAHAEGPELAMRLTQVLEPWLTRSFWQVIDSSELLAQGNPADPAQPPLSLEVPPDAAALSSWIALRDNTDAGSWPLRWVGDNLPESHIGEEISGDVLERYERLAQALQDRTEPKLPPCHPWHQGMNPILVALDTLALSATLGGALILSTVTSPRDGAPWPAQAMTLAGMNALRLDSADADSLFNTERLWIRDALVTAGLAVLAQRLPPLAVMHVLTDSVVPAPLPDPSTNGVAFDPWVNARAWWYRI